MTWQECRDTSLQKLFQCYNGPDEDEATLRYLALDPQKEERLLEDPSLLRTPIVRNGRQATVGYCPEVWSTWE